MYVNIFLSKIFLDLRRFFNVLCFCLNATNAIVILHKHIDFMFDVGTHIVTSEGIFQSSTMC